jgi:hypothetical protein
MADLNLDPRFDVYRCFENPDEVIMTAIGVISGKLRTLGIIINANDPNFSPDEAKVRDQLEPMLREWWKADLEKAAEAS